MKLRHFSTVSWKSSQRSSMSACIPTKAERAPDGTDWVYEIKHDGYRPMVTTSSTVTGNPQSTSSAWGT